MTRRYTGGFLSAQEQATDSNTANGIFTLADAQEKTALGNFPTGSWTPQRSLRFKRSASTYLSRTPTATGSRTTYTVSQWIKLGQLGSSPNGDSFIWTSGNSTVDDSCNLLWKTFDSNDWKLVLQHGNAYALQTSAKLKDPSAWYHIVSVIDSTAAVASERMKLYINGVLQTSFTASAYPTLNYAPAISTPSFDFTVGAIQLTGGRDRFFDGYMSEFHYVDGQALDASYFGTTDAETGVWVPKQYAGTYGVNGFYLPFKEANSGSSFNVGTNYSNDSINNLLMYSEQFDNGVWANAGAFGSWAGTVNVTANSTTDPLSGTTADTIAFTTDGGVGRCQRVPVSPNTTYTYSVYLKRNSSTAMSLVAHFGNNTTLIGYGSLNIESQLTASWNRISYTFTTPSNCNMLEVGLGKEGIIGPQSVYAWGGQLNMGSSAAAYVQTVTRNNLTPSNFTLSPVTSSSYDSMVDVPGIIAVTSQPDVGGVQRGNYPTLNTISPGAVTVGVLSNANLTITGPAANHYYTPATMPFPRTGKWYAEVTLQTVAGPYNVHVYGIGKVTNNFAINAQGGAGPNFYINNNGGATNQNTFSNAANGYYYIQNSNIGYTQAANDILRIAYDSGKVWFGINGNWCGPNCTSYTGSPATGANPTDTVDPSADWVLFAGPYSSCVSHVNFGQRPFSYAPPAGFKSLNTSNLPNPIIKRPSEHFDVKTWTGTGASRFIGNISVPATGYKISKSLRLRNGGTYLQSVWGTPAGNQRTHTFSAWMKRASVSTAEFPIYSHYTDASNRWYVRVEQNQVRVYMNVGGTTYEIISRDVVFQDRMWHHFVLAVDTTQSSAPERFKIYMDGVLMPHSGGSSYPPQNTNIRWNDNGPTAYIGCKDNGQTTNWDGAITEINHVDGTQLAASSFGEFDGNGYWIPKQYTGSYGTRGFYLPLSNSTTLESLTTDMSNGVSEMITNGRFVSNVSGWTVGPGVGGTPSITYVNGAARITNSQNNGVWYYQAIPTVVGRTYYAGCYVSNISIGASNRECRLKKADDANYTSNTALLGVMLQSAGQGSIRNTFVATSTTTYIIVEADILGTGNQGADFDNISVSEVGYKNNWNPVGISLTNDISYDSFVDSPTIYEDNSNNVDNGGEVRADYCILDKGTERPYAIVERGGYMANANTTSDSVVDGSLPILPDSKIYIEAFYAIQAGLGNTAILAVSDTFPYSNATARPGSFAGSWGYDYRLGNAWNQGTSTAVNGITTSGHTIMWAIDLAAGKMWAGVNGTWYTGNPSTGASPTVSGITNTRKIFQVEMDGGTGNRSSLDFNFGQKPFTYAPPTGFKSFNTKTLKDADNKTVSSPYGLLVNNVDLVWMKARNVANWHFLYDAVRGAGNRIMSNVTYGQSYETTTLNDFTPNGFSLGSDGVGGVNTNGTNHVGWCWNRGSTPGFDIVQYTGTGAIQTIQHKLGAKPKFMTFKSITSTGHWTTYHENMNGGTGDPTFGYINMNATGGFNLEAAGSTRTRWWGDRAPTSNEVTIGAGSTDQLNVAGQTYIGYLWSEVPGFSKIGYYTGNGSTDGTFVYCGFKPKYLLVKRADGISDWCIYDSIRDPQNRGTSSLLFAEDTGAETSGYPVDFVSNGFKNRYSAGNPNLSGAGYIYMAFAENPFKYASAR